ncbi:MAG: hypothetical protein JWQ38_34 [Flavipsychrobacter sp.]|nr:hypothetical protein [Flavipsychrobacter sp.]
MKKNLNIIPTPIHGRERVNLKKTARALFLFIAVLFMSNVANASHFRFGLITATRLSETFGSPGTVTYRLNVSLSWRLGTAMTPIPFTISGGNTGGVNVPMTTVTDPSGGWENSTGSATITLNKSATITRIEYTNCCKISTTANNHDTNWDVYCLLNTNAPGSSPVSTLPAIINMPIGATAATFTIPASDPDPGSTLTYGMPVLTSGPLNGEVQPSGATVNNANFNINSSTGLVTFNTVGKSVGQQYNAMTTVTDNNGNQIELDYLINMVGPSNPPVFDYTSGVTPLNGSVFNIIVGQTLSFPIRATDPDAGQTVSMSVSGLTSFLTTANFTSAALPATGTASLTHLTYTPLAAQLGSTIVLNFIATDNVGVQTTSSVTIKVVGEPAPTFVSPTPGQGTIRSILAGALHTDNIVAQSSLGSNVSIAFASVPSGVTNSPSVPTPGANPGSTTLSWTPTSADFGQHTLTYQAIISATPTIFATRSFDLIVDDLPAFTSSPVTAASACNHYKYLVTASDANIPYGDIVDIMSDNPLPSWLTITTTGNGTATMSGTPGLADVGTYNIDIHAEDNYPHNYASVDQSFTITVSANTITASAGANGTISGAGAVVVCPGSTPTYTITADAGYHIADVLVDGVSIGAVTSYTFATISADHTISASFASNCNPVVILAAATTTPVTCNAGSDGSVTTYIDGTTPVTYAWSNGATSANLSAVPAGTYTYTVTNACGTASGSATVKEPTALIVSATNTAILCNGGSSVVTVSATGGTTPYSGDGAQPAMTAGGYSYTVTDHNGCTATATGNITEPAVLTASSANTAILCNGGTSVVTVTAAGGTTPYSGDGPQTPVHGGGYSYTVTDHNGCTATTTGSISEPTVLTASSTNTAILCNGGTSVVTVSATGGTLAYSGTGAKAPVYAGSYSYTVTDANGCTSTTTGTIGQPTALTAAASASPMYPVPGYAAYTIYLGYGAQTETLSESVSGGTPGYSYSWAPVSGTSSTLNVSPVSTTTYTVTVTDANGCVIKSTKTINVIDITCCAGKSGMCEKVNVCHGGKTLCVAASAVPAHLAHGDYLGACSGGKIVTTANGGSEDDEITSDAVKVYPNPTAGAFSVEIPAAHKIADIQVLDITGRVINKMTISDNEGHPVQFNIANAAKGLYIIKVAAGEQTYISKLIMN